MAHYLPRKKKSFRYDSRALNNFFYQQRQRFPKTLTFRFNDSGLWPVSEELSQAISNMFGSGLIIVGSNRPWDYYFSPECEKSYREFVRKRTPKERIKDVRKIAFSFNKQPAIED
jgi:hypothetical protein